MKLRPWMSLKSSEINNCSWNSQSKTDIFFLNLLLLTSMLSNDHPTNIAFVKIDSEDKTCSLQNWIAPSSSRCIVWPVSKKIDDFLRDLVRRERGFCWFIINPLSFIHWNSVRWFNSFSLLWFCFRYRSGWQRTFAIDCDACYSGRSSGISVSVLFESITFLFDPWEILTQDWVLSSLRDPDSNFNSIFTVQITGRGLPIQVQFSSFPGSILLVVMIHRFLEECIHDKPLHKIVSPLVLSHEILSNLNNMY